MVYAITDLPSAPIYQICSRRTPTWTMIDTMAPQIHPYTARTHTATFCNCGGTAAPQINITADATNDTDYDESQ
jgi:hypothetical protein